MSWDKAYMNKQVTTTEPVEDTSNDLPAYIVGGILGVVFMVYFVIWLFEGLTQ